MFLNKSDFAKAMATEGGEGENRTREELSSLTVFKTVALDRYATSPNKTRRNVINLLCKFKRSSSVERNSLWENVLTLRRRQDSNLREPYSSGI